MEFLREWVTNIILFILLATVIDMLLPNSNMQKYTKVVIGLLLIVIILTPILKLLSSNFDEALLSIPKQTGNEEKNMKTLIDLKKKEIQASQHAYILETMAVQLKKDATEELMEQYGLSIANIHLEVDETSQEAFPQNLQKVIVLLQPQAKETAAVEAVKTIEIDTESPLSSKTESDKTQIIASFLSGKWNVNEKTIEVSIEGELNKKDG
jgi:stage III sporulation protein AF